MLRLAGYDIVFQEIPGEVTLALNISGCPNRCPGCHSRHLQRQTGGRLHDGLLLWLIDRYGSATTCVCFMGGDAEPKEVERLASVIRGRGLKTAWYSGRQRLPQGFDIRHFDYVKLGPYIADLGGLDCETTNQRFYKIEAGEMTDHTELFRKGR